MPDLSALPAALESCAQDLARQPVPVVLTILAVAAALVVVGRGRRPRPGEVWWAWVPFDEGRGGKDRPVLVLGRRGLRLEVARFTSRDQGRRSDHARVPDGVPGLTRGSWVDLRPRALPRRALRRRAGDAGPALVAWYEQARARGERDGARQG